MITDKDIQKLLAAFLKVFATKDDLNQFATKDDLKEFMTRNEMLDHLTEFRSDILSHVDAVYKELLAKRDEQVMHQAAHLRMQDTIENHQERIEKLESAVTS